MANTAQTRKRARQNIKVRAHRTGLRSAFRTSVKKVLKAIKAGDKKLAEESFKAAVPVIDRMVNKHIIHANKAARHKSRLNNSIRAM